MSIRDATRCGARSKRTGKACSQPAMRGTSVCRLHGGKAPQVRRAAERRSALSEARSMLGVPRHIDPADALVESVHEAAGNVEFLRTRVQRISEGEEEVSPLVATAVEDKYADWCDRLARMAKLAHDAGIEDRRVELAEAQAELLASAILAALSDSEWSLTPALQEAGRSVLGRHLRRLGAGEAVEEG